MLSRALVLALMVLGISFGTAEADSAGGASYLPLSAGVEWVLRDSSQSAPVVFRVNRQDANGFRMQVTLPWGSSEWTLADQGGKFVMTSFGTGGPMMSTLGDPIYLDFTSPAGTQWTNSLGTLQIVSRTATVQIGSSTYRNCIQIRHLAPGGADLLFAFARGIGYVQFATGPFVFSLDPKPPSNLPVSGPVTSAPGMDRVPVGLTPDPFANEPLTVSVMTERFNQTLQAGVNFLVGNDSWSQLEPRAGQYALYSLDQLVSLTASAKIPASYTLRVINTVARDVPPDLQLAEWTDPVLISRVLGLIDAIAPKLRGGVKWFTFGYEVDGYLAQHPKEVDGFTKLHRLATERMKQLVPGIKVSATITFSGLNQLDGRLSQLNRQMDFLAVTYCPLNRDYTVQDPSVLASDFATMKQSAAGRKVVLQEIAYPSSPIVASTEEKQAEFYQLAFHEVARDPLAFDAVNFMMLADLSTASAQRYAQYYGLNILSFRAALQTLGMFDGEGRPKKGWSVFCANVAR